MAFLNFLLTSMVGGPTGPQGSAGPLTVAGVNHSIEQAEISMRVETETFDAASQTWVYNRNPSIVVALEIRVNERSGEDGALSPDLYIALPTTAPANLNGFVLDQKDCTAEAFEGNDAPALEGNRLEFRSEPTTGDVKVLWTAISEKGDALHFEGPADFMGISLKVKKVTDVDGFLQRVWPALDVARLDLVSESEVDFGEDFPEDRRHWMELHYDLKPAP